MHTTYPRLSDLKAHFKHTHTYIHVYILTVGRSQGILQAAPACTHTYIHTYILYTFVQSDDLKAYFKQHLRAHIHTYIHTYMYTYIQSDDLKAYFKQLREETGLRVLKVRHIYIYIYIYIYIVTCMRAA